MIAPTKPRNFASIVDPRKVGALLRAIDGYVVEAVYDIACSDDRRIRNHRCSKVVGNTVDGASYPNDVGEALLDGWWQDPDFDPAQRTFYYVRVLEIPTPTWLAYDKAF